MTDPLVVFDHVTKIHHRGSEEVRALVDVSLEVSPGDFVVVTGPSGAGKSTMLHVGAGLENVDEGRVLVGGRDLADMNERSRAAWRCRGLGYVFQFFNLIGNLSATENVAMPLLLDGLRRQEADNRARAALAEVDLDAVADAVPAQLSGGQMQRVAVARALVTGAPLLFADEPTGNLDSVSSAGVLELLRRAREERGCAVVLVTHDESLIRSGDTLVRLQDGRRVVPVPV
jgi:ABC-type lipoprotein export system ATPase subunit